MSRHRLVNPEGFPEPSGFSYGAVSAEGRTVHIAGMTGTRDDGGYDESFADQFALACRHVAAVIVEAGGEPSDLVSMTIYTTTLSEYKENLRQVGKLWREVFGRHFPSMAIIGVSGLYEPEIKVELVSVAVVPGVTGLG